MPSTFEALAVLIAALLPGALYIWSFERLAGHWGAALSDRIVRFVGSSAVLHALAAPATYWFWSSQRAELSGAGSPSWWLWLLAIGYVAVPIAAGSAVGYGTRHEWGWTRLLTGPDPAPRAWDYLFQAERDGWVRLRMKSGVWLGGAYATGATAELKSYTAGYPEPQDIFLSEVVVLDPDSGDFVVDDDGAPQRTGSGLLVRWEEVEYLEFIEA